MRDFKDYLRMDKMPHFWCSGCGNGIALQAIARAMAEMDLDPKKTVLVTGIGCWGRIDDYFKVNTFHGTHGRALAFATGVQLSNPELTVFVAMGDGDGVTIGGNHFIHTARRNVNVTAILLNNYNYGMTGGQYSGTTPSGAITTTSRYGHIEEQFDICALAQGAGASFVARESVGNPVNLKRLIMDAAKVKGFSLVEVMSPCPTHFGRNNKIGDARAMMDQMGKKLDRSGKPIDPASGNIPAGILKCEPRPDYAARYGEIIERLKKEN